jgi:putative ABC transport system substrate-binding protein
MVVKFTVVRLVAALILGLASAPHLADAQQAGKVYRIGFLLTGSLRPQAHLLHQGFEQALGEHGRMTGWNLAIEYRSAEGKYDRLPALAAELVRLEPHVIVAVSTAAARAAKDATSTIPIVMWGVSDPIGDGLITSFARPGRNVTGLAITSTWDFYAKQLQLLKEAVPRARRIGFLWNPANSAALPGVRIVEKAAPSLGVELQVVGARTPEEFEPALLTSSPSAGVLLVKATSFAIRPGAPCSRSAKRRAA